MRCLIASNSSTNNTRRIPFGSVVVITLALLLIATSARAGLRDGDELWMINTRSISCNLNSANISNPALRVYRYQGASGFQVDTLDNLLIHSAQDTSCVNVLYIHGNRFTAQDAIKRVWNVYWRVRRQQSPAVRVRWILWSWPSDPTFGPLRDVRSKAMRADTQTLYVGWFLQRFTGTDRLHIIGYSFGGRVATGGLHVAAGGTVGGRAVIGQPMLGQQIGVSLIAPALDRHWLSSGANHGLAVENIRQLNLFYNNHDGILKLYSMISKYYDPVALGFAGLSGLAPRSDGLPIAVCSKNCSGTVGINHDELKYYEHGCSAINTISASIDATFPLSPHQLMMLPAGSDFDH